MRDLQMVEHAGNDEIDKIVDRARSRVEPRCGRQKNRAGARERSMFSR